MRRYGAFILLLMTAVPAVAADPPPADETPSIPWYRWVFLGERSKPKPAKPAVATTAAKPPTREAAARLLAEENKVYIQRLAAISQIRRVADEQGDEAMLKKADELEEQAAKVHAERTGKLAGAAEGADDRAALERGRDTTPATAERSTSRRRTPRGGDR